MIGKSAPQVLTSLHIKNHEQLMVWRYDEHHDIFSYFHETTNHQSENYMDFKSVNRIVKNFYIGLKILMGCCHNS